MKIPVYILSGGESRRFGRQDKARAIWRGKPLILHVKEALREVTLDLYVIADRPQKYADLGLQTLADEVLSQGPLGGLQAALKHAGDGWICLAACDLIGTQSSWIQTLMEHAAPEVSAVAFAHAGGAGSHEHPHPREQWEPLLALYHHRALPTINERLERGQRAMWRLLETLPTHALPLPGDWGRLSVVNRPSDLPKEPPSLT